MKRSSIRQKQNIPYTCEPRPSLRMTMTAKKKPQKSDARMSVLPLKRQRLSVNLQPHQFTQSRPSLRTNINLLNTVNITPLHSCQRSIRKQTIINNLVNKLDEEEQIRSIIQTKLKRNSYGPNKQFMYTSQFQPYSSNNSLQVSQKNLTQQLANLMDNSSSMFHGATNRCDMKDNDQSAVSVIGSKLRQCQDQLDYFKSIVNEMSKKIKLMERQKANCSTNSNYVSDFKAEKRDSLLQNSHNCHQNYTSNNMNSNRCVNCGYCKCTGNMSQRNQNPRLIDANTQTDTEDNTMPNKTEQTSNYEFDFFDNLDRTLKILSNSKNL